MLESLSIDCRCVAGMVVAMYPKVVVNKRLIYSKSAKRVKRHNSFTVSYINPQQPCRVSYGEVEMFVTCPVSSDSVHAVVLKPFEVSSCEVLQILHYPPEISNVQPLLADDYISVTRCSSPLTAIPIGHVSMTIFNVSIPEFSGLTTLVNEKRNCIVNFILVQV